MKSKLLFIVMTLSLVVSGCKRDLTIDEKSFCDSEIQGFSGLSDESALNQLSNQLSKLAENSSDVIERYSIQDGEVEVSADRFAAFRQGYETEQRRQGVPEDQINLLASIAPLFIAKRSAQLIYDYNSCLRHASDPVIIKAKDLDNVSIFSFEYKNKFTAKRPGYDKFMQYEINQ